jgi:hypothetical protein
MRRAALLLAVAAACAPPERTQPPVTTAPPRVDAWLGDWKGVEGTFLRLERTRTGTDGDGTGMKWLADREDCLVVTAGSEGFCR